MCQAYERPGGAPGISLSEHPADSATMCCTSRGSRFGRARRLLLTDAARQVVEAVGAEPRVEPGHAIERFVSPFFYRHLVSGESIDEKFVDRQIEMLSLDLGLTSGVAMGDRGVD